MAVFIAAVGNGGTLYRPRIVTSIEDSQGNIVQSIEPAITGGLPTSKENLALVQRGLWDVVQGDRGTGRRIRIKGIDIAGKTGTAQVFSRKTGEKFDNKNISRTLRDHAWFVCYAPAQDPKIAIAVIIEHGEHGASSAAPVAGALIKKYLQAQAPEIQTPEIQTPETPKP